MTKEPEEQVWQQDDVTDPEGGDTAAGDGEAAPGGVTSPDDPDGADADSASEGVLPGEVADVLAGWPGPEADGVQAQLDALRAEAAANLEDARRYKAEFENFRKRMIREQTDVTGRASQRLVERLLPVLDNLSLAVGAAEQVGAGDADAPVARVEWDRMRKGVEMVLGELQEILRAEGVSAIEPIGEPFDPSRHEAVLAVEQEGTEEGTVLDVIRTGYAMKGRVLRPAMVKVSR